MPSESDNHTHVSYVNDDLIHMFGEEARVQVLHETFSRSAELICIDHSCTSTAIEKPYVSHMWMEISRLDETST